MADERGQMEGPGSAAWIDMQLSHDTTGRAIACATNAEHDRPNPFRTPQPGVSRSTPSRWSVINAFSNRATSCVVVNAQPCLAPALLSVHGRSRLQAQGFEMRTRLASFFTFVAILGLTPGAAQAADKFECPAIGGQDAPKLSADLAKTLPTGGALDNLAALQNAVDLLLTNGVAASSTVNHLMASYCPWLAGNGQLSAADKTKQMRRFANRVTGLVYSSQNAEEIIFSVPLNPMEAADLEARANAANMTPGAWIARSLRSTLKTP